MDDEKKVIKVGAEARQSIKNVLKIVKATVSATLGPKGRNALIDRGRNDRSPLITNDGKTILKSMRLNGPIKIGDETIECGEAEDKVLATVFEIAKNTDEVAGDGTTTATTLGVAITETCLDRISDEGVRIPGSNQNSPMELAAQLEEEKTKAIGELWKMSEPVDTLEKLKDVAFTSLENEEVAGIVADAMWKIGKDGFATIEDGYEGVVEAETISGIQIYGKVAAPFMYTNDKRQSVFLNAPVLVTNATFANLVPLQNLLDDWGKNPDSRKFTSFVVMATKFEASALRQILNIERQTHEASKGQSAFRVLAVKVPSLTDEELEDIAGYLDATFINTDSKVGDKLEKVRFKDLGFVEKLIAGDDETVLIGGRGTKTSTLIKHPDRPDEILTRVDMRLRQLNDTLTVEHDEIFKKKLQRRIEILSGGIALLRVGAPTDTERAYLKLKVEDAKNACKAALQEGMVPGGGNAFAAVAERLGEESLLYGPLMTPKGIIQRDVGEIPANIKDPTKIARCAIENAVSVAKILITTETIIADKSKDVGDELKQMLGV